MNNEFSYEIFKRWEDTRHIQPAWDKLNKGSEINHPFTSYDWFDCWYPAFCEPEEERIIVVRDSTSIRAIFPGMIKTLTRMGLTFNCFSYAANGHTPRCGIISYRNDFDAIRSALLAPFQRMENEVDIVVLLSVNESSPLFNLLQPKFLNKITIRIEHSFESPTIDLSSGWETYYQSRSKKFKYNLKYYNNLATRTGSVDYIKANSSCIDNNNIELLRSIDAKTWQYENSTGLFSNEHNSKFYTSLLLKNQLAGAKLLVHYMMVNDVVASYSLNIETEDTVFILKTGYDSKYAKISPGMLNWLNFIRDTAEERKSTVEMLGELDTYKQNWETGRIMHFNYWLVNSTTAKGLFLITVLAMHRALVILQKALVGVFTKQTTKSYLRRLLEYGK